MIPIEKIEQRIFLIRGHKVMLDTDLAHIYGVTTKALNQAVKRNIRRFPQDFMFRLSRLEKQEVVTNCDHLEKLKFSSNLPCAFTEHGILMLANVLNSERAVAMSLIIVRIFVRLREMLATNKVLAEKLNQLERRVEKHDEEIQAIFNAIRRLMAPSESPKRRIGFCP